MKKVIILCLCAVVAIIAVGFFIKPNPTTLQNSDYLRIHIRANSNQKQDQDIKYQIKDKMVEYLTPKIATCTTKEQVVDMILQNKNQLTEVANNLLKQNGFDYTANIKINSEVFPTRTYEGYTLKSGVYDAIIVELGLAKGNNWWCVIYPPLCFVDAGSNYYQNIVYKSKIWEIIKQFFC